MLNYTGRKWQNLHIDRKGFPSAKKTWRYTKHKDRKYCGKFDIRIHDSTGKMEHEVLLKSCVTYLSRESVREIYHGNDPYEIGLEGEALEIGCDIQCAFAEQEINWESLTSSLAPNFGDPDRKEDDDLLYNAVPRDFFMLYLERCFHEIKENGHSVESVFELAVTPLPEFIKRSSKSCSSGLQYLKEGLGIRTGNLFTAVFQFGKLKDGFHLF